MLQPGHHSQANQIDTCTDFAVCLNEIIIDLRAFEYGTTGAFHLDYFFEARRQTANFTFCLNYRVEYLQTL